MDFSHTLRLSMTLLAAAVSIGCSDDADDDGGAEPISVQISEQLEITWDGGPVGEIDVDWCRDDPGVDTCLPDSRCDFQGGVWSGDSFSSTGMNTIAAPLQFGAPIGDRPGADEGDLEPGVVYALEVIRWADCEAEGGEGCRDQIGVGCVSFQVDP
ncbi:MAG: hypothetical protein AAF715_11355 [Myxococcota bacterium]